MQSLEELYLMQKLQKQSYKMYLKILENKYSFTQDRALESIWNFTKYVNKNFETTLIDYIWLSEHGKIYTSYL